MHGAQILTEAKKLQIHTNETKIRITVSKSELPQAQPHSNFTIYLPHTNTQYNKYVSTIYLSVRNKIMRNDRRALFIILRDDGDCARDGKPVTREGKRREKERGTHNIYKDLCLEREIDYSCASESTFTCLK